MNDPEQNELLALCDSIIEDGELTYDELYDLAEWLNNHRGACLQWPGDLLVKPLQEIWANGKISASEARQMARLINKIGKEGARQRAEQAFARAAELAADASRTFDLSRAELPPIAFAAQIKSQTDNGVFYDVHLTGPTCSCPDYRSFRYNLLPGHLTRCCKHIFGAYAQLEPPDSWPGWLRAFFRLSWPPRPRTEWFVAELSGLLVLISSAPTGWSNVFASDRGPYDRFGYNIAEDRWAYGVAPPGSDRITRAVIAFEESCEQAKQAPPRDS